jgi:hypothetical protein
MQQVKLFKGVENDLAGLEKEINHWIRQSGAKILSVTGNVAPQGQAREGASGSLGGSHFATSDVFVIVFYEEA